MKAIATSLLAGALLLPSLASGAPVYRATDVGLLGGATETLLYDLGDRGDVIGFSGTEEISWNAATGLRPILQPKDPGEVLVVRAINASRATAGFVDADGLATRRPVLVSASRQPTFFLDDTWAARGLDPVTPIRDLSNHGEVLGVSSRPWLWSATAGLRAIGTGYSDEYKVARVNDRSQVVGYRVLDLIGNHCQGERAFVYDAATERFTPLDGGPADIEQDACYWFSHANAINDRGQVVGWSFRDESPDQARKHPFIWSPAEGREPLRNPDPRKVDLIPLDVNNRGQVVGTFQYSDHVGELKDRRFFYWDAESGVVDLQDLLDPADPLSAQIDLRTDDVTVRINAGGAIMAAGRLSGSKATRAFVLTPR